MQSCDVSLLLFIEQTKKLKSKSSMMVIWSAQQQLQPYLSPLSLCPALPQPWRMLIPNNNLFLKHTRPRCRQDPQSARSSPADRSAGAIFLVGSVHVIALSLRELVLP